MPEAACSRCSAVGRVSLSWSETLDLVVLIRNQRGSGLWGAPPVPSPRTRTVSSACDAACITRSETWASGQCSRLDEAAHQPKDASYEEEHEGRGHAGHPASCASWLLRAAFLCMHPSGCQWSGCPAGCSGRRPFSRRNCSGIPGTRPAPWSRRDVDHCRHEDRSDGGTSLQIVTRLSVRLSFRSYLEPSGLLN